MYNLWNKSYKNCGNEVKWTMILAVVNPINAIAYEDWKKFRTDWLQSLFYFFFFFRLLTQLHKLREDHSSFDFIWTGSPNEFIQLMINLWTGDQFIFCFKNALFV